MHADQNLCRHQSLVALDLTINRRRTQKTSGPWKINSEGWGLEALPCSVREKLVSLRRLRNSPALKETQQFVTMFITACHCSLFWVRWIEFTPCRHISLRSILTLDYPVITLKSEMWSPIIMFLTKTLHTCLIDTCITYPANTILLRHTQCTSFPWDAHIFLPQ
jgi:hypothetical protein